MAMLIIILFLLLVPMLYQLFAPVGSARFSKVTILDQGAINKIEQQRFELSQRYSGLVPRIISNKATYFVVEFTKNYFSHF